MSGHCKLIYYAHLHKVTLISIIEPLQKAETAHTSVGNAWGMWENGCAVLSARKK